MTVIDLTGEKYKQNKVVVKCGDHRSRQETNQRWLCFKP